MREKHPGVATTLAGTDKLVVEDKVVTWDIGKKKIVTKPVYTLPRREKNRCGALRTLNTTYLFAFYLLDQS